MLNGGEAGAAAARPSKRPAPSSVTERDTNFLKPAVQSAGVLSVASSKRSLPPWALDDEVENKLAAVNSNAVTANAIKAASSQAAPWSKMQSGAGFGGKKSSSSSSRSTALWDTAATKQE